MIKCRTIIWATLLLLMIACQAGSISTLTLSQTVAATPSPPVPPILTSIPDLTPIPVFALTPELVWRLSFSGIVCPATAVCDVVLEGPSHFYVVNSDGGGLAVLDISPVPGPRVLRFSLDGSRLAFRDGVDVVLASSDGSIVTRFENLPGIYFDFLGSDCLALYKYDYKSPQNQVAIEKICVDDTEPQVLDMVEFPAQQRDYFRSYQIAPQGDKLLAYVQSVEGGDVRLYIKELNSDTVARLLFHSPSRSCDRWYQDVSPFRWRQDGETVELLWVSRCGDQVENVFYQIDWQEGEPQVRMTISDVFITGGDWSPDGREFAFSYHPGGSLQGAEAGVHILDLETTEWHQIVSEIYVSHIITWPSNNVESHR